MSGVHVCIVIKMKEYPPISARPLVDYVRGSGGYPYGGLLLLTLSRDEAYT